VLVDWAVNGSRTGVVYVLKNVEIIIKSQQTPWWALNTTTIAIIIIIGAILLLERKRIQAVVGKRIKREAKPKKPPEELE
jgi:uncharacterized membrane protein SirB2